MAVAWLVKSFVCDPDVLCFPPVSMKLGRLTCELASRLRSDIFTVLDTHPLSHPRNNLDSYVSKPLHFGPVVFFFITLTNTVTVTSYWKISKILKYINSSLSNKMMKIKDINLLNEGIELDKYFQNMSECTLVLSNIWWKIMFYIQICLQYIHCLNLIPPPSLESHNAQKFIKDSEKPCSKENYLHYLTSSIS